MIQPQRLVFGTGLMAPTLDGSKRFTVRCFRPEAHRFKKGDLVIGEFKDGFNILLTITADTIIAPFKELKRSKRWANKNGGHHFNAEYFQSLKKYYPHITWKTIGAVVQFEVFKVESVPAVGFNQHAR